MVLIATLGGVLTSRVVVAVHVGTTFVVAVVNVEAGSVGYLANMADQQRAAARVLALAAGLNILNLFCYRIARYGRCADRDRSASMTKPVTVATCERPSRSAVIAAFNAFCRVNGYQSNPV